MPRREREDSGILGFVKKHTIQIIIWVFACGVAWGQFQAMRTELAKMQALITMMIQEDGPKLTELSVTQREHARRLAELEENRR